MTVFDEVKRLRQRDSEVINASTRLLSGRSSGAPCLISRTTTLSNYPSAAASYYACNAVAVLGPEVEGGPGIISSDSGTFFALNIGSTIPPVGTQVLVTFIGNRWVFRYDG
jgi:hypothetical protein